MYIVESKFRFNHKTHKDGDQVYIGYIGRQDPVRIDYYLCKAVIRRGWFVPTNVLYGYDENRPVYQSRSYAFQEYMYVFSNRKDAKNWLIRKLKESENQLKSKINKINMDLRTYKIFISEEDE